MALFIRTVFRLKAEHNELTTKQDLRRTLRATDSQIGSDFIFR